MFKAVVWDLETTDLTSFMGRLLVASFLDLNTDEVVTRDIVQDKKGHDEGERRLVAWVLKQIEDADVLIGHNTIGFDLGFIRGRAAALGLPSVLPKRTHIDTMQVLKYGFRGRIQGNSLENALEFFDCEHRKDKPPKWDWARSRHLESDAIVRLRQRCEFDVRGNAEVWHHLREHYYNWRGRN